MYVASSSPQPTEVGMKAMERRLSGVDGVQEAFQFSEHKAGLQANGELGFAQVIGIRQENLQEFELIANSIVQGSLEGFGQGRGSDQQIAMFYVNLLVMRRVNPSLSLHGKIAMRRRQRRYGQNKLRCGLSL